MYTPMNLQWKMSLMKYMQVSDDRHKEVGIIAAKYLETLQRSNEQLVKIAALASKKEGAQEEITDKELMIFTSLTWIERTT